MSTITKKDIQRELRSAIFTPSQPGPLKVILDVGNYSYFLRRASELLKEAELPMMNTSDSSLELALKLIAMAKAIHNKNNPKSYNITCPAIDLFPKEN